MTVERLPSGWTRLKSVPLASRVRLARRLVITVDIVMLLLAIPLSGVLDSQTGGPARKLVLSGLLLLGWLAFTSVEVTHLRAARRSRASSVAEFPGIAGATAGLAWLTFGLSWLISSTDLTFPEVGRFWLMVVAFVVVGRAGSRAFLRLGDSSLQRTVIVGAGDVGQQLARTLMRHPECGFEVVGFVDAEPRQLAPDLRGLSVIGEPDQLPGIIRDRAVERVVLAFTRESHEEALDIVHTLREFDVRIDIFSRLFEVIGANAAVHTVAGVPLMELPACYLSKTARALKRTMDIAIAGLGLLLLAPVFAVIALLIKLDSPGPVFFRQTRIGSGNTRFVMYKFRTMVVGADALKTELAALNRHAANGGDSRMFKIVDDPRVTRLGGLLRSYFADELPQLINVLKGEMTLVGPRPLIPEEDQHVDGRGRRRLDLKPGMTGVWQVLGRSAISFEEMVRLDCRYVSDWSLRNDWYLLARTIPVVLKGSGRLS